MRSEGNMSLKNPMTPSGIDSRTVRLVAQCLNHYATPGPEEETVLQSMCESLTEIGRCFGVEMNMERVR